MKRVQLLIVLLTVLLAGSCSLYDKKAVQVAESYTQQYICPLFDDAKLSDHMKGKKYRWEKMHRLVYKFDYNALFLDRESKVSKPYYRGYSVGNESRENLIEYALQSSALDAIRADTNYQALCVFSVSVKSKERYPMTFDIIVSKDYAVMNPPIDLQEIEQMITSTE